MSDAAYTSTAWVALREAALRPRIFSELADTHLEASEDMIVSYLLTRKFTKRGARVCAETFIATMEYVGLREPR